MPCRDSLISAFDACAVSLARPSVKTRGVRSICSLLQPGAGCLFPSPVEGSFPAAILSTLTKGLAASPAASRTCFRSSDATTYCVHWSYVTGLLCSSFGSLGRQYSMRMHIEKMCLTNESAELWSDGTALGPTEEDASGVGPTREPLHARTLTFSSFAFGNASCWEELPAPTVTAASDVSTGGGASAR